MGASEAGAAGGSEWAVLAWFIMKGWDGEPRRCSRWRCRCSRSWHRSVERRLTKPYMAAN